MLTLGAAAAGCLLGYGGVHRPAFGRDQGRPFVGFFHSADPRAGPATEVAMALLHGPAAPPRYPLDKVPEVFVGDFPAEFVGETFGEDKGW